MPLLKNNVPSTSALLSAGPLLAETERCMRFTVQRSLGPQGGSGIRGREAHTGIRPNGSLQNDHGTIILKWLVESPCSKDKNEKQQASKPNRDPLTASPDPCVHGEAHAYTDQSLHTHAS